MPGSVAAESRAGKNLKSKDMQSNLMPVPQPSPADLAFEKFSQVFPLVSGWVALNGSYLHYKLPNVASLHRNLTEAKRIISEQKLPLSVRGISNYCTNILHIVYQNPQA